MTAQTLTRILIDISETTAGAIVLKSSVVMLLTIVLLVALRRASASIRHLLVAASFAVVLLMPLVSGLVPAREFKLAPPRSAEPVATRLEEHAVVNTVITPKRAVGVSLMTIAIRTYIGVAALMIGSLLFGIARVYRLRNRAEVSVRATRLANELSTRGVYVAISDELAVPITFGRVILLPAATADWTEEELLRAIRHELEHITRGDWATQIVSRLAFAVYWPHPFVWALWHQLRLEAERACDDAVIRSRGEAEPYAEQLVSLARRVAGHGCVPALSMATRSNLAVRIEAILDGTRRRRPLTRFASLSMAAIALATMLAIAPVKLMSDVLETPHDDQEYSIDMALLNAAGRGDVEEMRHLINQGAKANAVLRGDGSPLIAAARRGNLEAMDLLINAGADVNRGVRGDGNPLINAAREGHLDAVRLLLDRGAHIDAGVEGDGNALIMAAGEGQLEVVRFLLDRGASIEYVVNSDENPLIHACEGGHADVVRYLISRGANVNARVWTDFGSEHEGEWRTPMSMAKRGGHEDIVKILVAAGAKQ